MNVHNFENKILISHSQVHLILIKPVLSDPVLCVTVFQCSHGRSHKTGLMVFVWNCKLAILLCLWP